MVKWQAFIKLGFAVIVPYLPANNLNYHRIIDFDMLEEFLQNSEPGLDLNLNLNSEKKIWKFGI